MKTLSLGVVGGAQSTRVPGVGAGGEKFPATLLRFVVVLIPVLLFSGTLALLAGGPATWNSPLPSILAGMLLLGVLTGGHEGKHIKAGRRHHAVAQSGLFTLSLDNETVALEPGKTWLQLDHFKWVVRGIIEAPQSLRIAPDGSLEINSEKIAITDPDGPEKLEHQINKRHETPVSHKVEPTFTVSRPAMTAPKPAKPHFHVKLDHWGHVLIEWGEGLDKEETSLRGLSTLVAQGLIRKPEKYHVDPLQRGIEIDGTFYECNEAGAKRLEEALNNRYAEERKDKGVGIEIKENAAASTGLDIHFTILRAGVPFEVKGHLSQENLDILQDPAKCDLLQPGLHLLLTPPYLLFRRRRPDMGEEKIPEMPDVNLLRTSAPQLQQILNSPLIRRGGTGAVAQALQAAGDRPREIAEMRVYQHPEDKSHLWVECVTSTGQSHRAKAFTHHNIAEFQHGGTFLPQLDVCLSLDHRRLSILNRETKHEEVLTLDPHSPEEELRKASRMLTQALRPTVSAPPPPPVTGSEPVEPAPSAATPEVAPPVTEAPPQVSFKREAASPPKRELDPFTAMFCESDAARINREVFGRLATWLGLTTQEIFLSLPMVFEHRRFEILSFEQQQIQSLQELRSEDFYGFYLSHVSEKKIVLVYACNGTHIEWGPEKCVLQPTAQSEAEEYKGSALLGLAQNRKDEFVFVVKPEFKEWIVPREQPYTVENVCFMNVADLAAAPGEFRLIWPAPAAA